MSSTGCSKLRRAFSAPFLLDIDTLSLSSLAFPFPFPSFAGDSILLDSSLLWTRLATRGIGGSIGASPGAFELVSAGSPWLVRGRAGDSTEGEKGEGGAESGGLLGGGRSSSKSKVICKGETRGRSLFGLLFAWPAAEDGAAAVVTLEL